MISNRKARLLLGVPNIRVGEISQYRISNRFWIMVLDNGYRWGSYRKRSARQNREHLHWLESRITEAYAPDAAERYAALSIGRQIHVEAEKIVNELLDGAGKPVADFDYVARTFSMPRTFELARKVVMDLHSRTDELLRQAIAERYGDVDTEAFAKDSLRKCWPDREEYFYKDDLLLTVHKPRWDEITFEIHRGPKHGD